MQNQDANVIRLFKLSEDDTLLLQSTILNQMLYLRKLREETTDANTREFYSNQITELSALSVNISEQIQRYFPKKNK